MRNLVIKRLLQSFESGADYSVLKSKVETIRCVRDRYPQLLHMARSEHEPFFPLGEGQVEPEVFLRGLDDEKLLDLFGQEYEQANCPMA